MTRILDRGVRPTAVFGANGPTPLGAVRALHARLGREAASAIDVISFDDLDWFDFTTPRISAVRNDAASIGRLGVRGLIDLIDGRPVESQRVAMELVDRSAA